ncbi:MAG: hypothetical protein K0R57_991 [Paenibacillaceae bacterium]|jgi:uncharacterized membrane protein SpoIIM required for sporulation|nr:hypothetical protein [Paenibacillaceae bacterium]
MEMKRLLSRHRKNWMELDGLLQIFDRHPGKVDAGHISRLTRLYRSASSHLSLLQSRYPHDELTLYLNQLVSRAHHVLYKEQHNSGVQLSAFFGQYFIGLLTRRRTFIIAAALLFTVGAFSGFVSILMDGDNLGALLPSQIADNIDPSRTGEGLSGMSHSIVSSEIMTNNIRVAVLAFAAGITFGIYTVYILAFNGLMIGALAAVYWKAGETYLFWAYILPHGIIELTAIFIAGGAGLYMGYKMWVPGQYSWRLQLLQCAKESVQLLLGTIPLFVIAGVIEGYITPSGLSLAAKYAFALLTLFLLAAYYAYGTRRGRLAQAPSPLPGIVRPNA